jgi:hypothetical protein
MRGPFVPTELEAYLFDLRGYLVLEAAVKADHVSRLNGILDTYQDMAPDTWRGNVHRVLDTTRSAHLHNIFEMGEDFESLIDHASWLDHINRFVGGDGLCIDESFVDVRDTGHASPLHSGAHKRRIRTQFRFHNNEFRCGQINILLALTDVGDGDGPTMIIPGSHKSNLLHPAFRDRPTSLDEVPGAIEVPLKAGDALLFVDCSAHGAARRTNSGQRRMLIIRYGPHWAQDRYGYVPSDKLISRLTPARRKIIQPLPPKRPPGL